MEFTKDDFGKNVAMLEGALGHPINETPCKLTRMLRRGLRPENREMILAARDGKFASCALVEFLVKGNGSELVVRDEEHAVIQSFFAPLWNESDHATIDFMRKPGFTIKVLIRDAGLRQEVEELWRRREVLAEEEGGDVILETLTLLDHGVYRVAEPDKESENGWRTNGWLKQAILLSFKILPNDLIKGASGDTFWYDKVLSKFTEWDRGRFQEAGIRTVPPCAVRYGAFIGKKVILMPSFVNIGGYVDDGTMVDTWATVGSCAQIGKNVHLSGGVGIGGVLEPLQANPTIIEDNCFIGARSEVVEGVIVREGAVLSMGVFIGKNTPIVDRTHANRVIHGHVPNNAVVMMGVHPVNGLTCPQIVKYRDEKTDAATALNEALRG